MNISLLSFTSQGAVTEVAIQQALGKQGHLVKAYSKKVQGQPTLFPMDQSLGQWTEHEFCQADALVYIGAVGIAVRAIAPYIQSKTTDPAVIVVDEKGLFCIALLAGHLGGANKLTKEIAELIGATPVITTATDLNGKFAVDQWAKENNCFIDSMAIAKDISAAVLEGETIGFSSTLPVKGDICSELKEIPRTKLKHQETSGLSLGIAVSTAREGAELTFALQTLQLIPRVFTLGIGCRKHVPYEKLEAFVSQVLMRENIRWEAISKIASIDLKENEDGLQTLAQVHQVPFEVYTAKELKEAAGEFTPSAFVSSVTGVDNVCERAAVLASNGTLFVKKESRDGMTVALAYKAHCLKF